MPVSKNRRKNKKAQRRKVNRAKAESSPGWDGVPDSFDYPSRAVAHPERFPKFRPMGTGTGGNPRYGVTNPPDDPVLSEMEQIDASIERSVTFEMTETHHDNIGLGEIDLGGEMSGGDISGPMVATITIDPPLGHRRTPQVEDGAGTDRLPGLRPQRIQGRVRRQPVAGLGESRGWNAHPR